MARYAFTMAALAATVMASPQNIDLFQVAAAPSVASGPNVTDAMGVQTASLFTSFTVTGATTAPTTAAPVATAVATPAVNARAVGNTDVISFNQIITAYAASLGSASSLTSINAGISYWLSGGGAQDFFGNIQNAGRIFVSQTALLKTTFAGGQTVDWSGHDANSGNLVNNAGALLQLNDLGAASAATYDWSLHSMHNNGTLQWCGRGDTGGCTFQLYTDLDAYNYGQISWEQFNGNLGSSFEWSSGANLHNYGVFHLLNLVLHIIQDILGDGCLQIDIGACLYLEAGAGISANGSPLAGQSIIFLDASAILHLDAGVYASNPNFGAEIHGYAPGNALEFSELIKDFAYAEASGILSVNFWSGNSVHLNIGLGFDAGLFIMKNNPTPYNLIGFNAIFYIGVDVEISLGLGSQCSISIPTCTPLSSGLPPTSTATWTSTAKPTSTPVWTSGAKPTSTSTFTSNVKPTSTPTSTATSAPKSSSSAKTSSVSSSAKVTSTSAPWTSTSILPVTGTPPVTTEPVCTSTPYTPYYPALATSYTTNPALSGTTTAGQACPTQPEAGTYCGFINPEDPCAPQPDGYGPVPTPDTASAFLNYPPFHSDANAAPTTIPSTNGAEYVEVFKDLDASVQAQSYLGLHTLETYDVEECASLCDCTDLCTAFNIYAERDPSLNPSANDSTAPTVWGYYCPNPPSMTTFRCTLWGSNIDAADATNYGSTREQFQIVIAASNGYDKTNSTTPGSPTGPSTTPTISSTAKSVSSTATSSATGFSTSTYPKKSTSPLSSASSQTLTSSRLTGVSSQPVTSSTPTWATSSSSAATWGQSSSPTWTSSGAPISTGQPTSCPNNPFPWSAPVNCNGKAIDAPEYFLGSRFFPGPYNPQVCSDYAFAQTSLNAQSDVSQFATMFNAYYLHKNGAPYGTYCALYNSALDITFATDIGATFGTDFFGVYQSWTFSLDICVEVGLGISL